MKLSLTELQNFVKTLVGTNKTAQLTYTTSFDNTANLLDKIGKIFQIEGKYKDRLPELDGEYLPYGKTIEEYFQDLVEPVDYDTLEDTDALKYYPGTFRPAAYNYTLGKVVIPLSFKYNDFQRAVNNAEQYARLVASYANKITSSKNLYRYGIKRQLIGDFITKVLNAENTATVYAKSTKYDEGTYLKESAASNTRGVVVKPIAATNQSEWSALVDNGTIIPLTMVVEVAKPVDTTTADDFLLQVRKDVETALDASEGNSLSGNTLGSYGDGDNKLMLYTLKGVLPVVDVKSLAGAFHLDKVAMPTEAKSLPDFGKGTDSDVFAVLVDPRGVKLHPTFDMMMENPNGAKGFINRFMHTESTGFISPNVFIKVYRVPQGA